MRVVWSSTSPLRGIVFGAGIALSACSVAKVTDDTGDPDPTIEEVDVVPAHLDLLVAGTGQFTATPRDAHGAPVTGCTVGWQSSNGSIAHVNDQGLVTALAAGDATITASCGSVAGTGTVTVSGATGSAEELFRDSFESGALGDAGRWHDITGSGRSIVTASNEGISAVSGTRVLKLAANGGSMTHFVATGASSPHERLHLSFYLYRTSAYEAANPGLRAGGIRGSTTQWGSFGVGYGTPGSCPDDPNNAHQQEFMFAYVFNDATGWVLRTYTNWIGQRKLTENPPTCGGGYAIAAGNDPQATYHDISYSPSVNAWHRYEIEVQLNTVGQADGWQRMWVDGVLKIEHLNVEYRTTAGMKLWAVTFDTGTIHGGALYVDDVLVQSRRAP